MQLSSVIAIWAMPKRKHFFCRSPLLKENDGGNVGYAGKRRLFCVDSGTVSLFALTSDLTNSETVAATL